MAFILIVEDEEDLGDILAYTLEREGMKVRSASRGAEALRLAREDPPDLILLDLMLPDISGVDVCRQLKGDPRTQAIPLIMLTARGEEEDRIRGLEMGADDYLVKPFPLRELTLRVQAVVRSTRGTPTDRQAGSILLDLAGHRALVDGAPIDLTPLELSLLQTLLEKKDLVVSRDDLLSTVWQDKEEISERAIDTVIRRLRTKLGTAASQIETVRGFGYRIRGD